MAVPDACNWLAKSFHISRLALVYAYLAAPHLPPANALQD
ncbi:hypothetical protein C4K35_4819 [Pseudomonas chlororaphis subsp. piscium]|nr:hypothetical protein C4K35_4819 [Pseudomonas chlororaphis subsp. piscium]AZD49968.1 hypothetical protein C4K20_4567 [Pseudomonas chlororaphis subsp. aurantiaca]AZC71214.1 hypothetical protein C4K32_4566 [Pseudomonas chlororaphis subsp. piscium]AZC77438.1 hypothetical protein C4K31_4549 [Pseudomonas chlororaphis subsp. piscium]AZC83657.1 hypothetical protein C4K30_4557 [Pseudomonas chlororaphis subsp. piscium]